MNIVTFAQTLPNLITAYTSLETALGAVARTKAFTTQVKPEDDAGQELLQSVPDWSIPREIAFKNVTVSYK